METTTPLNYEEQLNNLFGDYKAEWLRDRIFDVFTAPEYLPDLTTARPCVLVGGRGTGKTTVLRGLSYEGQFAFRQNKRDALRSLDFYGLYYRVNTNRVTAFKGNELEESEWVRLFGHYLNLLLIDATVKFLTWFQLNAKQEVALTLEDRDLLAEALHIDSFASISELAQRVRRAQVSFEAYVNNVLNGTRPQLSMQGAPLDILYAALGTFRTSVGRTSAFS